MTDTPKHKYRTRAVHNQTAENCGISYKDLDSSDYSSDYSNYDSESPEATRKRFNNKRRNCKERSTATLYNVNTIPEIQYPSKWLSQTVATKLPYIPQIGDTVVYFQQGHEKYLQTIKVQSGIKSSLNAQDYCKVTGVKFKILPPQICCLKLSILDDDGHLTGETFTVKYHYLPQLPDFIVLKQVFDKALQQNFTIGTKIRCIKNQKVWWFGTIESIEPIDIKFPTSHFMCCKVKWDNGGSGLLSPWELEPLDSQDFSSVPIGEAPVSWDVYKLLYKPESDEWPLQDWERICHRIMQYFDQLIYSSIAENFVNPVNINTYPEYARVIAYPINLLIIRARLENKFYRRITALKFDLRYLRINTEIFNVPNSEIVKQARILTDICLDIIKNIDKELNIAEMLEKTKRSYVISNSDMEVEGIVNKQSVSSGSSSKKRVNDDCQIVISANLPSKSMRISPEHQLIRRRAVFPRNVIGDWKSECKHLLKVIWNDKDSIPFRNPVDPLDFPDYKRIVAIEMCLQWVKNSLEDGDYKNPKMFEKDMKTIFSNSRLYNPDKNTEIYKMTTRLSYLFDDFMEPILAKWVNKGSHKPNNKSVKSNNIKVRIVDAEEESLSSDYNEEDDNNDDDDSEYIPDTQSTMESDDLSQITDDLSQILSAELNVPVEVRNRDSDLCIIHDGMHNNSYADSAALVQNVTNCSNDAEDDANADNIDDWEHGWTQVLAESPILDRNFYKK